MNYHPALTGAHLRTYNTIFQHPVSHNLEWHAVRALFEKLGHIEDQTNGKLKVTRNGHSLTLQQPSTKDVADADEVMTLRNFLERSEEVPAETNGREPHWLLVIDAHEARVFRSEVCGGVPREILPYGPEAYFRHAHNSKGFPRGKDKPEPSSFFEPVARALKGEGKILIFGAGNGISSEMNHFLNWSEIHHPDVFKRVVGTQVIDEQHLTQGQLFAKGQEFYSNPSLTSV